MHIMTMPTLFLLLAVAALILTLFVASGKVHPWVPLFIVCFILCLMAGMQSGIH